MMLVTWLKLTEHLHYDDGRFNMVSWLEADWVKLGPQLEALYRGGDTNDLR